MNNKNLFTLILDLLTSLSVDGEALDGGFRALSPDTGGGVVEDGWDWRSKDWIKVGRDWGGGGTAEGLAEVRELAATAVIRAHASWVVVQDSEGTETIVQGSWEDLLFDTTKVGSHELAVQQETDTGDTVDFAAVQEPADVLLGWVEEDLHVVDVAGLADLDGDEEVEGSDAVGGLGDIDLTFVADVDAVVGQVEGEAETGDFIEDLEDTSSKANIISSITDKDIRVGILLGPVGLDGSDVLKDESTRLWHRDEFFSSDKVLIVHGIGIKARVVVGVDLGVKETTTAAKGKAAFNTTTSDNTALTPVGPIDTWSINIAVILQGKTWGVGVKVKVIQVDTLAFLAFAGAVRAGAAG